MPLIHIKASPTLKGETQFVTLNLILRNQSTSQEAWEEQLLKANPEVMSYFSKGKILFVTDEEYAKERKAVEKAAEDAERLDAALDPDLVTVEDALEVDNPSYAEARKIAGQAKLLIEKLEVMLAGGGAARSPQAKAAPAKPQAAEAPKDEKDGLDLPMSAPAGLKPQATTEQYLRKTAAEKRKFLKECHDITMLRDIALFEADAKMKALARKAALGAEKSAQEASRMAQAS